MAKYVVKPSISKRPVLIKCHKCGTLYLPETKERLCSYDYYEACPNCKYSFNNDDERISLWRYNLIKAWREYRGNTDEQQNKQEALVTIPFWWLVKFCRHTLFKEPMSDRERANSWKVILRTEFDTPFENIIWNEDKE